MLSRLKRLFPPRFFARRWYHHLRGELAAARRGYPARRMRVIGVTGTNGKTTTTTLIAEMLVASGRRVAMATTIQFRIGERVWVNETHKTTMSPARLQSFIREAADAGCTDLVLEVSSHALDQGRLRGIPFTVAVFTNLTPEHLDYHVTMGAYGEAKQQLFRRLGGRPGSVSVVNANDPAADAFLRHSSASVWTVNVEDHPQHGFPSLYGRTGVTPLEAAQVVAGQTSTSFVLRWHDQQLPVTMQLLGRFNVENAALAAAAALASGVEPRDVQRVLAAVPLIPGRLEPVDAGQDFRALIDYAVTPDSLEKLYATLRPITPGRIIAVFGACGDRDRSKRPVMGEVAGRLADVVILTNEEPYGEDPQSILDQIAPGVRRTAKVEGRDFFVLLDRRQAIDRAVELARSGDTIVLSGMGNQTSMVWGARTIPWSDREQLRESLALRAKTPRA